MEKLKSILFSTRLMAVLFFTYAFAMACGTFIESKYNTDTARILVYNAWWFEAIHVFFVINFFGNIQRYQLYKKEKWATLILHLSFIFIIIGAFITRYISYEGMMPIRENEISNLVYSDKNFLTVFVDGDYKGEMKRRVFEEPVLLSAATSNNYSINDKFAEIPFEVELLEYLMDAKETIKPNANGKLHLKLVESSGGTRHEHYLIEGEVQNIHNILFAFNKETKGAINITFKDNKTTIYSPFDGQFMRMADKLQGKVAKDSVQDLMYRSLYNLAEAQFVFPEQPINGTKDFVSSGNYKNKRAEDILKLKISSGGEEKIVTVKGSKGKQGEPVSVKVGKLEYTLFFGSKVYELPFKIKLNDFIAQKYPGTEKSFSSFESQVTVMDGAENKNERIYMNHILDYKGFRFFQASYDEDQKGTVLSVNHDFWGTNITYIGYYLLYFGLMAILFTKHSRFGDLKRKLEAIKKKKSAYLTILLLMLTLVGFSQNHANHSQIPTLKQIDSIINKYKVAPKHAAQFGRLVIQDEGGRMKPINTFSSELLRKVSKSDTYKDMNSDQVFMSMTQFPTVWFEVPIIYLKKGNDSIRKIIGIKSEDQYASFRNFFDENGNYKLSPFLDNAYKTANPNNFEKDFIEADKKVNLLNSALSGKILRVFPVPNDSNNKWVSFLEINHKTGTALDTVKNVLPVYFDELLKATDKNDYTMANTFLVGLENYQRKVGAAVRPSDDKIDSEILYNKYDVFQKLPYLYLTMSILMLMFTILQIFYDKKGLSIAINVSHIIIALLFALHTFALIVRWYISGHAPWSDAYESIIYVAWATMFFGLAFDFKLVKRYLPKPLLPSELSIISSLMYVRLKVESESKLTVASCAFVTAMILAAAYANWIDPAIGNLQPVLNSYWLMIHVAVIVASYGPFALGMILGFVALLLIAFTNSKNKAKMELSIKEITYINEMALTIGLVMLTIGNFLGGQWANESWGRYWGWDPKETWALISIMVYAFVIHARFVPLLRGLWIFNLMSMFAFVSILFTYYGVNFHLVGLHSYASGEAKSLSWIYYTLFAFSVIGALAYPSYKKYYKNKKVN
ncbi:cytochrome c biogenesis protein [Flavobacterium sp.]|uniref:cytochrome c biogenesis protein n=1 Tax=Flavobacterium sp. TaxID=239 RepID=UPI002B4AB842|nr:cytochrome c biogenesis protein CcsA [Flavobacterium sp.]HLP64823.1 cytochrome c biogenesis protein CcsA [Flavobacterium sp.]